MSTHTPIEVEVLASSECAREDCEHEDECPTKPATVCLECNTAAQGTDDWTLWEGSIARCAAVEFAAKPDADTPEPRARG